MTNAQRKSPVDKTSVARIARCAIEKLQIKASGTLVIAFVDSVSMRNLNKRFLHHDYPTDVLSFRYGKEAPCPRPVNTHEREILGEIVISPDAAQRFAKERCLNYEQELARYVIHGLLHYLGHHDRTLSQQKKMRTIETHLLS